MQNPVKHLKMELFVTTVNGFLSLTFVTKGSILDVWLGFEYGTGSSSQDPCF